MKASGLSKWTDLLEREVDVGYTSQGGLSTTYASMVSTVHGIGCQLQPTAARCHPTVAIMQHHENCFAYTQFRKVGSRLFVRMLKAWALSNRIYGMPFDFHSLRVECTVGHRPNDSHQQEAKSTHAGTKYCGYPVSNSFFAHAECNGIGK